LAPDAGINIFLLPVGKGHITVRLPSLSPGDRWPTFRSSRLRLDLLFLGIDALRNCWHKPSVLDSASVKPLVSVVRLWGAMELNEGANLRNVSFSLCYFPQSVFKQPVEMGLLHHWLKAQLGNSFQ
jgi:hypothetical protein